MDVDVAISGGSVEGICTSVGFLKAIITDLKHNIISAAGTSAGGIILGACASGVPIDQLEETIINTQFSDFVTLPKWYDIFRMYRAFHYGWMSDGKRFDKFLQELTNNKNINDSIYDLYLTGSDFTIQNIAIFSKRKTPDMPLWQAMRITSCLPGAFKPVLYNGHIFYDGGVRRHYPIDIIPIADRPLYGYLLGESINKTVSEKLAPGFINTFGGFIDNSIDANISDAIRRSRHVKMRKDITITYDDTKVGTFDFNLSKSEKTRLIETARQLTLKTINQ